MSWEQYLRFFRVFFKLSSIISSTYLSCNLLTGMVQEDLNSSSTMYQFTDQVCFSEWCTTYISIQLYSEGKTMQLHFSCMNLENWSECILLLTLPQELLPPVFDNLLNLFQSTTCLFKCEEENPKSLVTWSFQSLSHFAPLTLWPISLSPPWSSTVQLHNTPGIQGYTGWVSTKTGCLQGVGL